MPTLRGPPGETDGARNISRRQFLCRGLLNRYTMHGLEFLYPGNSEVGNPGNLRFLNSRSSGNFPVIGAIAKLAIKGRCRDWNWMSTSNWTDPNHCWALLSNIRILSSGWSPILQLNHFRPRPHALISKTLDRQVTWWFLKYLLNAFTHLRKWSTIYVL